MHRHTINCSQIRYFDRLSRELNFVARDRQRKSTLPTDAVVNSQSIRTGQALTNIGERGLNKHKSSTYTPKRPRMLSVQGRNIASLPAEKHILYGEDFFLFGGEDVVDFFHEAVVERTFAWLESFRRLNRNYEQFPYTAKEVALAACAMFMLRFV